MEPLIKSENYNFTFYKKMLEKIKQCKDALCPDNKEANQVLYLSLDAWAVTFYLHILISYVVSVN